MKKSFAQELRSKVEGIFKHAMKLYEAGQHDQALEFCRSILAVRPAHRASLHLVASIEHGVRSMHFTAMHLSNPLHYHIGNWSYGVPIVFPHYHPQQPTWLRVGNYCTIAHAVEMVLGSYHRQDWFTIYPFSALHMGSLFPEAAGIPDFNWTKGSIDIGSDVWIGMHCIIMSGVKIGHGAVIGAGSVITRDVGPYEIWAGNPAKLIRLRFGPERIAQLLALRWWDWPHEMVVKHAHLLMQEGDAPMATLQQAKADMIAGLNAKADGDLYYPGATGVIRLRLPKQWDPDQPTVLLLHGSQGCIETVTTLGAALAPLNVVALDLPGFGQSWPSDQVTVDAMLEELLPALLDLLPGPYHVGGVSFGGAIALALARRDSRCRQVILIDTPMSALKLWHNQAFLREEIALTPDACFLQQFAWNMYGVTPQVCAERSYWHLLENQTIPITMVSGDISMHPQRPTPQVACCVDDDDLARLAAMGVHIARLKGGHDLAHDATAGLAALIDERVRSL